jgi:hypothetical protein
MQNGNDRPPYIRFERRAREDREASIKAGIYKSKDVDFAILMRPGSRDTIEREVKDWLADWRQKSTQGLIPIPWVADAEKGYEYWLKGEEIPLTGTAIKGWPVLSPAAQENIIKAGFRTVEDLAACPDGSLPLIGIGAVTYKQKAQAWLAAGEDKGKLAEANAALQLQVNTMAAQMKEMADALLSLKAQLPKKA